MIKLPEFVEFAKTITPEDCDKLIKDSAINAEELKERFKSEGYSVVSSALTERNFSLSIGLLSLYHEWLSEQLNKD